MADTITIRQDAEGRYCLNDLHKAAGEAEKDKPTNFFRLDSTAGLVTELLQCSDMSTAPFRVIRGGTNPGTYVCKELVYAYAMWISASFHLKVIRAYDTLATKGIAVHENAAASFLENPLPFFEEVLNQAKLVSPSSFPSDPPPEFNCKEH